MTRSNQVKNEVAIDLTRDFVGCELPYADGQLGQKWMRGVLIRLRPECFVFQNDAPRRWRGKLQNAPTVLMPKPSVDCNDLNLNLAAQAVRIILAIMLRDC